MQATHRARYGGREGHSFHVLCAPLFPNLHVLTLEACEPHPFGVLWRLHYTGMMKSLAIGKQIQSPALVPSPGDLGVD